MNSVSILKLLHGVQLQSVRSGFAAFDMLHFFISLVHEQSKYQDTKFHSKGINSAEHASYGTYLSESFISCCEKYLDEQRIKLSLPRGQ